ncbi:MAG: undecaprenyl-diphosphatase UppP [Deltaproteobacteria bacterium]|nr:undecaprenyl-diphosphatase UppP [Deltaproteobacteria bacterium]
MNGPYIQSIILGIVQGLGEFLPISSSAHLVITPWALNFPDPGLAFDVALHFGTLFALLSFFWKDWLHFFKSIPGKSEEQRLDRRLFLYLAIATIPGAIFGFLLDDLAETAFRHPLLVAVNMSVLGAILLIADSKIRDGKKLNQISLWSALIVGFSQALALVPGVSRSGVTMTAALFAGFSRETAARFSFLLAMPITFGACVYKMPDLFSNGISGQAIVGILVSALVGFLSIKYLLKYLQAHSFRIFVYYRFAFTIFVIFLYSFGRFIGRNGEVFH